MSRFNREVATTTLRTLLTYIWGPGLSIAFCSDCGTMLTLELIELDEHRLHGLIGAICHVRQVRCHLIARNATEAIRERWSGASWITELVYIGVRDRKSFRHVRVFTNTLHTSPKALLRLVQQRCPIEKGWHWVRDVRLGEDAHRYSQRNASRCWPWCVLRPYRRSMPEAILVAQQLVSLDPRGAAHR